MKKLWLAYAIFFIIVCVSGTIDTHTHGQPVTTLEIIEAVSELFMCVGVTLYALQKRLLSATAWKFVLWVIIAYSAVLAAYNTSKDGPSFLVALAIFTVPVIPAYVAMYRYAYMSPQVWRRAGT